MQKKHLATTLVFLASLFVASFAYAHETRTYEIAGTEYTFTIGSIGEPIIVDDKSGLDLTIRKDGAPFIGAENVLRVEVGSGSIKKMYDLETVYGQEGKYKTTFFLTTADPLSYRLIGTLESKSVDLLFTCAPSGHNMAAMEANTARAAISDGVVRTSLRGAFGCPAPKSEYEFPSVTMDQFGLAAGVERNRERSMLGLIVGALALICGVAALSGMSLRGTQREYTENMRGAYAFGLVGMMVGGVIGYGVFALTPERVDVAAQDTAPVHAMNHPMTEVGPNTPAPTVAIQAIKDSKDGYNVRVRTTNFTFTPEAVGTGAEPNKGHAHLYVNGVKIARLYGEWFNIGNSLLADGDNEILVTLNANDHSEWAQNGQHISATVMVRK